MKRLAVKNQQDALFATVGRYAQIRRDGTYEAGAGAEAVILGSLMDGEWQIDVYDAPCGHGYVLRQFFEGSRLEYDPLVQANQLIRYETSRAIGFGCAASDYTRDW